MYVNDIKNGTTAKDGWILFIFFVDKDIFNIKI